MTVYNIKTDFGAVGNGTTDDASAFVTAGNALAGTTGNELYLPTGTYKWNSNPSISGRSLNNGTHNLFGGCTQLLIRGDGSSLTTINVNGLCNQFGGGGIPGDGSHFAFISSASKGSLTAALVTLADYTKFSVNQWVMVCGLNIQDGYSSAAYPTGYGYPPNFQVFEYIQIGGINSSTGVITFNTSLVKSYLSTWPILNYGDALHTNGGGAAGIYSLPSDWNVTLEYRGITFADAVSSQQLYNNGKSITWRDCVFPDTLRPIPTQNQFWGAYNSSTTNTALYTEVDKNITTIVMDACTWGSIDFQSSSAENVTIQNGCNIQNLVGSGYNSTITDSTLLSFAPGNFLYGVPNTCSISNTSIGTFTSGGYFEKGSFDQGVSPFMEMISGVIRMPNGVSHITGMADNGSGKARFTVDNTGGFTVGLKAPVSFGVQELTMTAQTNSGSAVFTFASVPAWIVAGVAVSGQSLGYPGMPDGATVLSTTSTTITLSASATANVVSGSKVALTCPAFSSKTPTILAIPSSTTIDLDITIPTGFVWSYGIAMAGSAARWAIPGRSCFFTGTSGASKTFKVLSVTQDTNYTYIQTDQPGGWPAIPVDSKGVGINVPGATKISASNLSGASKYVEQLTWPLAQGKPSGSYFKHTYTGSDTNVGTTCLGNLVSISFNVTKAYSGTAPNLFVHLDLFDNLTFLVDGVLQGLGWGVDVRQTGNRIILPTNTATNGTKQTNDSSLLVPTWSSFLWMNTTPGYVLKNSNGSGGSVVDISGESSSVWPSVTIEIITDQGIALDATLLTAVVPLRLRLRA